MQVVKNKISPSQCILAISLLLLHGIALAQGELNIDEKGVMLHGYDPVSYFIAKQPELGWAAINSLHEGAIYYFSSSRNRDLFNANPQRYVPAYGGFCSYGIRMGKKLDIDPHAWKIVDNVLYFQLNPGTQLVWSNDLQENISIANKVWSDIRSTSISHLNK